MIPRPGWDLRADKKVESPLKKMCHPTKHQLVAHQGKESPKPPGSSLPPTDSTSARNKQGTPTGVAREGKRADQETGCTSPGPEKTTTSTREGTRAEQDVKHTNPRPGSPPALPQADLDHSNGVNLVSIGQDTLINRHINLPQTKKKEDTQKINKKIHKKRQKKETNRPENTQPSINQFYAPLPGTQRCNRRTTVPFKKMYISSNNPVTKLTHNTADFWQEPNERQTASHNLEYSMLYS